MSNCKSIFHLQLYFSILILYFISTRILSITFDFHNSYLCRYIRIIVGYLVSKSSNRSILLLIKDGVPQIKSHQN